MVMLLLLPLSMVALKINHPIHTHRPHTVKAIDMIESIGRDAEMGKITIREGIELLNKVFNGSTTTLSSLDLIVNYRTVRERYKVICCF